MRAIMGIGLESAREKRRYMATQTSQKQSKLSLFVGALFCTMLWGMAPSLIKTGYSLMNVVATGSILLYAGCRFFFGGLDGSGLCLDPGKTVSYAGKEGPESNPCSGFFPDFRSVLVLLSWGSSCIRYDGLGSVGIERLNGTDDVGMAFSFGKNDSAQSGRLHFGLCRDSGCQLQSGRIHVFSKWGRNGSRFAAQQRAFFNFDTDFFPEILAGSAFRLAVRSWRTWIDCCWMSAGRTCDCLVI